MNLTAEAPQPGHEFLSDLLIYSRLTKQKIILSPDKNSWSGWGYVRCCMVAILLISMNFDEFNS